MKKYLLILSLCLLSINISFAQYNYSLTDNIDKAMRTRVDFWKKVYTQITSKEAFLHDKDNVQIIYSKIKPPFSNRRKKGRYTKNAIRKIRTTLLSIAKKNFKGLNIEETRVNGIIGKNKTKKQVIKMAKRIRSQFGLRDNYYIGLKRSYLYLDYIQRIFKKYDVPKQLSFLPHVESSFNYQAYSKVGAAGIWQFMRGTARNYNLKVKYVIDERRDVFKATIAAARLLRTNFNNIKVWPLAITAYNHGLASMKRAVKSVGSKKISVIIDNYDGRRFGFASKNFYATFLATAEISSNPGKYFPSFTPVDKFRYSSMKLPRALSVSQLMKVLKLDKKTMKKYNPSIRAIAYRSSLLIPRGFEIKIPHATTLRLADYKTKLKNIKSNTKHLRLASTHKIGRGDSLYSLSKIYGVSVRDLISFNNISNPSKIYPGMKVRIPTRKQIKGQIAAVKRKQIVSIKPQKIEKGKVDTIAKAENPKLENKKPLTFFERLGIFKQKNRGHGQDIPKVSKSFQRTNDLEDKKSSKAADLVSLSHYHLSLVEKSKDLYQVIIETEETLGHFADWAGIRTQSIRNSNSMRNRSTIRLGQKIKIKLTSGQKVDFLAKRLEYHISIQEDFYQAFKVIGKDEYDIRKGDNIRQIMAKNEVPLWLLRQYQDAKFNITQAIYIGQKLFIPTIEKLN
jgi:membrane-bound lytic murein transglycosylase D